MPIRKSDGKWTVRRQIRHGFRNKSEALKFDAILESALAEARRRFREKITPCCNIRNKVDEFISDARAGLGRRPRGEKTLVRHRRRLLAFDRAFQHKPLDAISRDRLERWIKRRLASSRVGRDTVNQDLASLYAFARWAQAKGHAPALMPLLAVGKLRTTGKLPGTNRLPPPAMEMEEMKAILRRVKRLREDIGLFLLGMALFGLRPEAVASLRREDARLPRGDDPGRLHVRGLKAGLDREIAVQKNSTQEKWLKRCFGLGRRLGKDGKRNPLVPNQRGKSRRNPGGWTSATFANALRRVLRKLKISMRAYVIRHSCISWLQGRKEAALANVQSFAGHSRIDTQNAYSHRHGGEAALGYKMIGGVLDDII